MRSRWLISALSRTVTLAFSRPVHRRRFSATAAATTGVAVKKVTKSNFEPALEDLRVRIREADFVAIDLEMTGITSAPWRDPFEFDRSDVRYLKVKDSAEKFAVVQFGVCPFRWDGSKGSFIAHPHNLYLFPRKELPIDGPSYEFLCQTTSINFLAKYQFDFNACIHEVSANVTGEDNDLLPAIRVSSALEAPISECANAIYILVDLPDPVVVSYILFLCIWIISGISYLSRAQEAEALQILSSAYKDEFNNSLYNLEENVEMLFLSTADLLFTERMKNRFRQWCDELMKSSAKNYPLEENSDSNKMQFQTVFFKMRPAVLLDGFVSHQLKLIRQVLRKHFKDLVYIRSVDENAMWKNLVVYTDSEEDKASLRKELQEDLLRNTEARVKSAVGFRHVIDLLTSEEKLIVGHNCFLDIAHIYSKFFGPLPSSMIEFALAVHKNFPRIIDTKHLLNSSHVIQYLMKRSSKSLSSAFSLLCPRISSPSQHVASSSYVKVEVPADETRSSCFNSGAKHEAGYDAFMTGCVFAQACSHLGMKFELHSPSIDFSKNDKIRTYMNLLYPSWNSGTVIDLGTGIEVPDSSYKRRYPQIVFSNIVLVWGFPSNIKPKDLKECICKVFGPDSITSIFFLDSTAALIQFSKEELVNDFLILKDNLESNDDPISVLHPLAKLLEGGNTHAANYETYRDICGSSASKVLFVDQAEAVGIRWKTKVENGNGETQKFSSSESTGDSSAVKQVTGKKNDPKKQSHHQVSCEDILDSLHASKSLFVKQVRST